MNRLWYEQTLSLQGSAEHFFANLFVQNSLVQRMLVDDHNAFIAFCNQIAIVRLDRTVSMRHFPGRRWARVGMRRWIEYRFSGRQLGCLR